MIPGIRGNPVSGGGRVTRLALAVAAVSALSLLTVISGGRVAAQDFPTEISGRILQGTDGADFPLGVNAVLLVVDDQRQEIITTESKPVGTSGSFSFTDFVTGPGLSYRVAADSGDFTPSVDLVPGRDSFTGVELTIYEYTESFDDIRFSTYSMLIPSIDRAERLMGVLGVVRLINSGDRVWAPNLDNPNLTGLDLLRFNLPEGFSDLSVESGLPNGSILEILSGFAMTNPVPPGEFDIVMTYIINYSDDSLAFPLRLPYGSDHVRIMLPAGNTEVTGSGIGDGEEAIIEDTVYRVFDGQDYGRDSQLDVQFSSLPTPSLLENTRSFLEGRGYIIVIAWIAAAAMLGLLVYAFFFARHRTGASTRAEIASFPEYAGLGRSEIIDTIATLDQKRDAGEIEDADYAARRAVLTEAALSARATEAQPT